MNIHWKDWCWSWNSNTLATWCEELTHWKRPWCWKRLKAGGEGDNRGWDDWMASLTQWTWVWACFKSQWWIRKPGVLQSMGSQRVRHDWATELNWKGKKVTEYKEKIQSLLSSVLICVRLFVAPWTVAHQVPLSMGFSRQKYWSGLPFPFPGYLPDTSSAFTARQVLYH